MDMQKIKGIAYPNGKQIVSIKDADSKVLWSSFNPYETNINYVYDNLKFFGGAAKPLEKCIVRGSCSFSTSSQTPESPATLTCNNGEVQFVDGELSVSGSPSYFDCNENRYNIETLFGGILSYDEHDLINGKVYHRTNVFALRGSMDWVKQSISGNSYFGIDKSVVYFDLCTHFHKVFTATPANVGEFIETETMYLFNYNGTNDDIVEFEDWLDDCFAANEAVICVGKKLVPTIEEVTPLVPQQIVGWNDLQFFHNDTYGRCYIKYLVQLPPNNEIWYGASKKTSPKSLGPLTLISNTFADGYGVWKFDQEVTELPSLFLDFIAVPTLWLPKSCVGIAGTAIRGTTLINTNNWIHITTIGENLATEAGWKPNTLVFGRNFMGVNTANNSATRAVVFAAPEYNDNGGAYYYSPWFELSPDTTAFTANSSSFRNVRGYAVLRSPIMMVPSTGISFGIGVNRYYVPANLVNDYKTNARWRLIAPNKIYPMFETIINPFEDL